jgi:hypothetical protein
MGILKEAEFDFADTVFGSADFLDKPLAAINWQAIDGCFMREAAIQI